MEHAPNATLIEKVQKLLNLANCKGATEGEASAAMARVQEMLAKYNLTMAAIENHTAPTGTKATAEEAAMAKRVKTGYRGKGLYQWQRDLMANVAKAYYCLHFMTEERYEEKPGKWKLVKSHRLIGREVNVVTAIAMFDYLNGTISRLVAERYPHSEILSRSANSFKEGCANRLCIRLVERRDEADAAHRSENKTAGTDLSVVRGSEDDLNNDLMYGQEPGTTARRRAEWMARCARVREEQKNQPAPVREEPKPETEAERKARLKENEKWDKRWRREQERDRKREERKWNAKDLDAYYKGDQKGKEINLSAQVK